MIPLADREWLSPAEVAAWLGVDPKLVYRLASEDVSFPAVKVGGLIRIRRSRLDRWLDGHHPARLRPKPGFRRPLAARPSGPSSPAVTDPASGPAADSTLTRHPGGPE